MSDLSVGHMIAIENLLNTASPTLLVGAPGVGKTETILSAFDHVEAVLVSTMVEEDIAGLPYREDEYDYRTIPALFRNLQAADATGKTTCLFLDELDKARRSVADTLLTLIASRRVGRACLPKNTVIVAAANPPEYGGGDGISPAMLSRMSIIEFKPDANRWFQWALSKFKKNASHAVAEAVARGDIPIFSSIGDGFSQRITSPRTLALALSQYELLGPCDALDHHVKGLLTADSASTFLRIIEENAASDSEVTDEPLGDEDEDDNLDEESTSDAEVFKKSKTIRKAVRRIARRA